LCLTMFPWAKFRRAKGGVKAHVLLDHDGYLPAYVLVTDAKRSDVKLADSFYLNPGGRLRPCARTVGSERTSTRYRERRLINLINSLTCLGGGVYSLCVLSTERRHCWRSPRLQS
jgi:hypothetical protein